MRKPKNRADTEQPTKVDRPPHNQEERLTDAVIDQYLRTAGDTIREVETQLEQSFVLPRAATSLRIQ